jgi:hypothetical protein
VGEQSATSPLEVAFARLDYRGELERLNQRQAKALADEDMVEFDALNNRIGLLVRNHPEAKRQRAAAGAKFQSMRRHVCRPPRRVSRCFARRPSSGRPAGRPAARRGGAKAAGEPSQPGDDPPGRPRRWPGGSEFDSRTSDSPLNLVWQQALTFGVEELETLSELARIRAGWLGRWDVAA